MLRIPGTLNYKYDSPRPVTLLCASNRFINKDMFLGAINMAYASLCSASVNIRLAHAPCIKSVCGSDRASINQDELGHLPFLGLTKEQATVHLSLLRGILRHLDADSEHDDWVHVGMALHYETAGSSDGYALFDNWSRVGRKYKGKKDTRAKWRSFRSIPGKGFKIGTLFLMAEEAGASRETIFAEVEPFEICVGYQDAA